MMLILVISIFLFTSCATMQPPVWVKEFGTRTFSKDGLEGIGFVKFDKRDTTTLSSARQAAYNEAVKNLAIKLKTEVKGEIEHKMADKILYTGKKFQQETSDQVNSLTEILFNSVLGRKYFEEYIDYKNSLYWVYVWTTKAELNRVIAEELEKQEMKNLAIMKTCVQQTKNAEEQLVKGNLILGLKLLNEVVIQLNEIKGITVVDKVDNISLNIDTKNKINKLLSSLLLTSIGETQIETFKKTNINLDLVVSCKLQYEDKTIPVVGFPLRLNFVEGTGEAEKLKFTDNTGIAKFKVYRLDAHRNVIEITPEVEELKKDIPQVERFVYLKTIYYITAKSLRETKKMLVKIKPDKESFSSNVLLTELVARLKSLEFNITNKLPADYYLEVSVETEYLGDKITLPNGSQKSFAEIYSGSVGIELKEVNTNSLILSKSFIGIKGFGRTKKEAEENVIKKLAETAADYIDKNFVE